jgi:coenzyme F420 hydrogenase subunit beta
MRGIEQVVQAGLCTGCGACTSADIAGSGARMELQASGFLRPRFAAPLSAAQQQAALAVCPGVRLELQAEAPLHPEWGPLAGVHTGWSLDPEVRYRGSSGGVLSALLIHLLESGQAQFVVHVGMVEGEPLSSRQRLSRTRAEVLAGAGSRYAPAAGAADLDALFARGERFAFVGKPCEVAALRAYVAARPQRREQLVFVGSFFCAGTPSQHGTQAVLQALGTEAHEVVHFQYRGNGWPGYATARRQDGSERRMDYNRSWGELLGPTLQLRCKLCPDGTGEFADIACADAWYGRDGYPDFTERDGRSLVVARTPRGAALLQRAVQAEALALAPCDPGEIAAMQPYQETRKRVVLGRWLALGLRTGLWPRFRGLHLGAALRRGGLLLALRNCWGTFKRLASWKD